MNSAKIKRALKKQFPMLSDLKVRKGTGTLKEYYGITSREGNLWKLKDEIKINFPSFEAITGHQGMIKI